MKAFKKILCVVLCLLMVMSTVAFAGSETEATEE